MTERDGVDADSARGLAARVVVPRAHFAVDLSIGVAPGQTVAVMGPSGAGKSTLLAALAGLEPLAEGEIGVGGRLLDRTARPRVHVPAARRGIVLLGQDPRVFPHLTARENVAFGPRALGIPRSRALACAEVWLERVGLAGAGGRRPAQLSGGEQQRVAVARALAASPRVVLLDEPLVALDPETAGDIRGMLRARLAEVTVVAVTHDATDALALADRLVVMERGRVTQEGAVREVLDRPGTSFAAAIAGLNRVVGTAEAGGCRFDTELGRGFSLRGEGSADDGAGGERVAAVFRPAHVRVRTRREGENPSHNEWFARVERLEPSFGGMRLVASGASAEIPTVEAVGLEPGDAVVLQVDASHVRLIPA